MRVDGQLPHEDELSISLKWSIYGSLLYKKYIYPCRFEFALMRFVYLTNLRFGEIARPRRIFLLGKKR